MNYYEKLSKEIMIGIGGRENINLVTHCATRLRFEVKDNSKVNVKKLENTEGVMRVVISMGQYQLVIGTEVDSVFDYLVKSYQLERLTIKDKKEIVETKKGLSFYTNKVLSSISTCITPVLGGLVISGMLKSILVVLSLLGVIDSGSQTYVLLEMMGDTLFYFLPVLIAYTASKHFNCSTILSLMLAGLLVHPTFIEMVNEGSSVYFFGIPVKLMSYTSTLLPILITVWIQSIVEKLFAKTFFKKLGLLSLFPVFLVMAPITLILTAPAGSFIGDIIANAMLFIYEKAHVVGLFAVSFAMPFLIWTGSHWVLMPTSFSNMDSLGFDPFLWVGFLSWNVSQMAVSAAVFLKSKSKNLKSIAGSAFISVAVAGISEPTAYGITLKLKKPIIPTLIGCGIGGIFFGLTKVKLFALGANSLLTLPTLVDPKGGNNFIFAIIGIIIVFITTFILTWFFGFDESEFMTDSEKNTLEK